ncbi:hypothetical protein DNL40_02300 [Xylanimonas oleitrophica]|uniref:Uncharacterized protein n=1 Tax=Xylanimonas oleitrophica TaxID=2607479 RepID=A0A2W5YJ73_9MICO|nr:hypothetical protein DNL40_02300 [Xylanimonas oleitrophica]
MYLGAAAPGGAWSSRDRALAEALLLLEASACPGCGQPKGHAWDPRSEGEYEVEKVTCQACAAKGQATKRKEPGPGEYLLVHRVQDQAGDLAAPALADRSMDQTAHEQHRADERDQPPARDAVDAAYRADQQGS